MRLKKGDIYRENCARIIFCCSREQTSDSLANRRRILVEIKNKESKFDGLSTRKRGSLHRNHLLHSEGENSLLETEIGYHSPPASLLCSIVHFFPLDFHFARRSSINDLTRTDPN